MRKVGVLDVYNKGEADIADYEARKQDAQESEPFRRLWFSSYYVSDSEAHSD